MGKCGTTWGSGLKASRPDAMPLWRAFRLRLVALLTALAILAATIPIAYVQPAHAAALPAGYGVFEAAQLVINGRQVYPDVPLLVFGGRMLVPIRIVAETLGADVNWDGARQVASVDTGERHIEMTIGSVKATVDATEVKLDAPAVLYLGRTLVPLRFVAEALGCEVAWNETTRTATVQAAVSGGHVTAVELELLPEYAVLHVRTDGLATYKVAALSDPQRLVIDVMDVTPSLDWAEQAIGQAAIERVRIGTGGDGATYTRVVCDLVDAVRFDPVPAANGAGVDVRIYYKVSGVAWEGGGLTIRSTGPAATSTFSLTGPDRFVVDLPGASLVAGTQGIDVGTDGVVRVRIAQNQVSPDIVRVVLDLLKPATFTIAKTDAGLRVLPAGVTDPGGGTVTPPDPKDPPSAQSIDYQSTALGGRLALTLATDVQSEVVVGADGRQLQLQITGAAATGLAGATVADGLVEEYSIVPAAGGGGLAVVLRLSAYAGHRLTVDGRTVVLELTRSTLVGRRIVLDPGHGGPDPGCTSYSGVYEKYVNWPIAVALKAVLERAGAVVKLTKEQVDTRVTVDGYERTAMANSWGAEVFVSIHCNAFTSPNISGTEVYHYGNSAQSLRLAQVMLNSLTQLGMPNRGVRVGNYVVCRETTMPAVLIELGYLTNPSDERILLDPAKQVRAAELMAEAFQAFFR
jgi:N-acetylmuramoyl-L-alanine amidase